MTVGSILDRDQRRFLLLLNKTTSKATPEAIIIQPKSQVFTKPTTSLVHETVPETFSPMKEILKWFKDRDEFDLYGDQVAIKLRNIASPFARVTVQNRINTLLMEAELGMYDTENQFASTNMDHYYTETKVLIDESQPS